jgi:hypothetical protein
VYLRLCCRIYSEASNGKQSSAPRGSDAERSVRPQVKSKTSQGNGIDLSQVKSYHSQLKNHINARCRGVFTAHLMKYCMKYCAWTRHMALKMPCDQGMLEALIE